MENYRRMSLSMRASAYRGDVMMDERMKRSRGRSARHAALIGMALLAAPVLAQPLLPLPEPLERVSGPVVQAILLEGDRLPEGDVDALGRSQVSRRGEIGFVARVSRGGRGRVGLFRWVNGRISPLALEGQETGSGPLLVLGAFGDWA